MSLLERLARRQLIVVTGKGGVGKTMITAAIGSLLADQGRHVLLLEVDPRENLHEVFDVPPSGGEVLKVGTRLTLQNLQPIHVLQDLVRQHLRIEMLARRVIASPVFQHFIEGGPGLKELGILSHAEHVVRKPRARRARPVDTVVLDAPATGHGISLLAAPRLVSEVIQQGPIGAEARRLAQFVADRERTGVVVVTQAEEMPVQETLELREALLEQVGLQPDLLVVNGLYPCCPPQPGTAVRGSDADRLLVQLWQARRQVNERELKTLAEQWRGPMLELTMLPADRGPTLLAALRQQVLDEMRQAA